MADYQLFKLDPEKPNSASRFCLLVVSESIDVVFTYKTFRDALESYAFLTAARIGFIVKLLNRQFPYECPPLGESVEDRYPDKVLKEYAEFHGFKVFRKAPYSLSEALRALRRRGYHIFPDVPVDVSNVVSIFKSEGINL